MKVPTLARRLLIVPVALCAVLAGGAVGRVQDQCGPFTDVSTTLCPYVLEMYYLGITAGTSPTTYSPDATLTRGQAAVFVSKGVNQAIARSSRRAALGQWWTTTPHWDLGLGVTQVGPGAGLPQSDGTDIWVPNPDLSGTISRVRASDGAVIGTWTGAEGPFAVLVAMGRVFAVSQTYPATLYVIDPAADPTDVVSVASNIAAHPRSMAFDGSRIWIAGLGGPCVPPCFDTSAIAIVTPGTWSVEAVNVGAGEFGLLYDGTNMWVTLVSENKLIRMDATGAAIQSVDVGTSPTYPAFDGENIWVPNSEGSSVTVVRASSGQIVATLTGNGLAGPTAAAFDGERVLVTNPWTSTLSLWRAADLAPIGSLAAPDNSGPYGVCSDGIDFWITLSQTGELARF